MKKIVSIDGHDYTMKSSAYTQFAYKNLTGRSLMADLQIIMENQPKIATDLSLMDSVTEPLLDVSYIMIQEADASQVGDKESFIKSIESLYDDLKWVEDVIDLATNPISRQLQNKDK